MFFSPHSHVIIAFRALIGGEITEEDSLKFAEADYFSDVAAHGPLLHSAFIDYMLEFFDVWTESAGQFFRSAFAWALFDWQVQVY